MGASKTEVKKMSPTDIWQKRKEQGIVERVETREVRGRENKMGRDNKNE